MIACSFISIQSLVLKCRVRQQPSWTSTQTYTLACRWSYKWWMSSSHILLHISWTCWPNLAGVLGGLPDWVRHYFVMSNIVFVEDRSGNHANQGSCWTLTRVFSSKGSKQLWSLTLNCRPLFWTYLVVVIIPSGDYKWARIEIYAKAEPDVISNWNWVHLILSWHHWRCAV